MFEKIEMPEEVVDSVDEEDSEDEVVSNLEEDSVEDTVVTRASTLLTEEDDLSPTICTLSILDPEELEEEQVPVVSSNNLERTDPGVDSINKVASLVEVDSVEDSEVDSITPDTWEAVLPFLVQPKSLSRMYVASFPT
jgi:hypothetical protein